MSRSFLLPRVGRVVHRAPLPALLLLAPLLWLFRSVLFFGEVFAFRDSAHYYFPLYRFVQESWATGLPLWNPFDGIGQPLLGDPTAAVLYPGKLLFCLPMEYRVCFAIYVVAHLWLAGVGAFYCAQHFRTGWHGALLAGFSYELGGHVLFQYCNPVFSVGAAWLPWGLLLTEQIVTGVGRGTYLDGKHSLLTLRRESVLFAGVLTLMVLGGDPQMAYHCVLIGGLRACFLPRGRWQAMRSIGAVALLALLLSAVQVLPAVEWSAQSDRALRFHPRSVWEWTADSLKSKKLLGVDGLWTKARPQDDHANKTYDFSVGPWRWAELVCPNVTGKWFPLHQRWTRALTAEKRLWTPTLYAGLLAFILAAMRCRLWRGNVRVRWLTWMALLCVLATLGEYSFGWLVNEIRYAMMRDDYVPARAANAVGGVYWLLNVCLPGYASFRYPAKWWTVAALGISLLAGFGWRHLFRSATIRVFAWKRFCLMATLLLLPVTLLAMAILWQGNVESNPLFGPFDLAGARIGLLFSLGHSVLVGAVLLSLCSASNTFRPTIALAISVLEIVFANGHLVATTPPIEVNNIKTLQQACLYRSEPSEAYPLAWNKRGSVDRFADLHACDTRSLMPKHHLASRTRSLQSSVSMSRADYASLWKVAAERDERSGDDEATRRLLTLLGARYALGPPEAFPSLSSKETLGSVTRNVVHKNPAANPGAWVVHRWKTLEPIPETSTAQQILARTDEVWDVAQGFRLPGQFAVLESPKNDAEAGRDSVMPKSLQPGDSKDTCDIIEKQPGRVVISGYSTGNGILVLGDQFYPGWMATTQDEGGAKRKVPILRVNRVMRGVRLQPGAFHVEFRYRPNSLLVGAIVSCITLVILIALPFARNARTR